MIGIIGKVIESSFLINLFGDTNIARIFYKSIPNNKEAKF
jgi:hypothetical protein